MSNNTIIPGCGIHHVALRTSDIERSLQFYLEGLGCTLRARWGEGDSRVAMVDLGDGAVLELFHGGSNEGPCQEQKAGGWFHLALSVENADDAFTRAVQFGAREKIAPKDALIDAVPAPMKVRIAFVYGPDGEILEFFQSC